LNEVSLGEPTIVKPVADWPDRLRGVLGQLGVSAPPGSTHKQMLDALHGMLAIADAYTLDGQLVDEIESIAAAVNADRAAASPAEHIAISDSTYPALESIELVVGDITTLDVDAIVNAANTALLGCRIPNHRCIDNTIHSAAGPRLRDDCATIIAAQQRPEAVGDAKITRGYALPARFVVHTVGPQLRPGNSPTPVEAEQLASAYRSCLNAAAEVDSISSIAFCGISTGVFAFPRPQAASIALRAIADWVADNPDRFDRIVIDCYTHDDATYYVKELHDWN